MTLDPTTLSSKRLWLRAKDLTGVDGAAVSAWTDQSGTSHSPTGIFGITKETGETPSGGVTARSISGSAINLPALHPNNGVVATVSTQFNSGYTPGSLVDSDYGGNGWASNAAPSTGTPQWARFQFPTGTVVTSLKIYPTNVARAPKDFTISGSMDGSTWTTLDTRTAVSWPTSAAQTFSFTNTTAYTYYRLNCTATVSADLLHLMEVEFNGVANGEVGSDADLWMVVRSASSSSTNPSWAFGSGGGSDWYPYVDGNVYSAGFASARNFAFAPSMTIVGQWRLVRITQTGGVSKFYIDGVQQASVSATSSWNAAPILRGLADFAEVLVFNAVAGTDPTAWLIDYFNTEHGLTVAGGSPPPGPIAATPPKATATVSAPAPVMRMSIILAPPKATATASAPAPKLNLFLAVPKATATALALAASITFGAAPLPFNPPPASVSASAPAPAMGMGPFAFAPPAASATGAAPAPAITLGAFGFTPPPGRDTAAAIAPSLNIAGQPLVFAAPRALATAAAIPPALAIPVVGVPWNADLSQRTLLAITTAVTSPTFVAPLAAIPASVVERPIVRSSVVMPDPTTLDPADVRTDPRTGRIVVRDDVYDAFPVTTAIVGVPHIIIGGRDVTYFRDSRTIVRNDQASEPFGDQTLVVEFPQIDSMDDPDDPDLTWLATDKPVHYVMQRWDADGPTGQVDTLFSGFLVSDDTGNDETTLQTVWTARGDLYAAAMFAHQPRLMVNPVDIGTQVPKVFNGVTNRPYGTIPAKATGIRTLQRGEPNSKVMSYAQALLGDAWTVGGNQWTVAKKVGTRNRYEVRLKKTGVDWIVTNGQRGVSIDLSADRTQHPNVIYGRGQRSDGGVWMNKKFPESGKTAPDYPYSSAGTVMSIGSTDAGTTDGDGVSKWQRRAKALGFSVTVDGVFSSADAATCRALQRQYGILVDGIVGPQTWAETFDIGALGADPDSWVRLPLAWVPGTQKRRYSATGVDLGPDPAYNPAMRVVSDDIDMGTDVSLADGVRSGQQIIDRGNPLPLTGTITLTTDPRQGWRGSIQAGDRIQVIGYKGRNVTLHIADRGRDWTGKGPITLQVAEKATDALTLAQIRQRDNSNRADPARRPGKVRTKPVIDPWDCESNAGHIERRAQYGGLWSVTRMPMSEVGRIARLNLTCSSATQFAFFIFAKQITSAQMIRYVGANPSAIADPGSTHRELLEDQFGWIEGFGGSNGMLGHFPNGPTGAVTGRAQESGIDYYSPDGYLYLAIWTAASTFIEGDMRAAPPEA